jgi:hypothetical protein
VSGELAKASRNELQEGPQADKAGAASGPFTARQLSRLDEALTLSSRETGLTFSVYVGEFKPPARAHAEALVERLDDGCTSSPARTRRSGCPTAPARSPRWRCARRSRPAISSAGS